MLWIDLRPGVSQTTTPQLSHTLIVFGRICYTVTGRSGNHCVLNVDRLLGFGLFQFSLIVKVLVSALKNRYMV